MNNRNRGMSGRYNSGFNDRFYGNGGYGNHNSGHQGGYMRGYGGGNSRPGPFDMANNFSENDLMQLMSVMTNNFSVNAPPQPTRIGCGELRAQHHGMLVELTGRLIKKRVARFVELRDRQGGACQIVILEDKYPRLARRLYNMPENTVLTIVGVVNRRPIHSCNQTMPTGNIEVEVQEILTIGFPTGSRRAGEKRTYSTMTAQNNCSITSTEYKTAKSENILKYFENRDITCNDLRKADVGKTVSLVGWIPAAKNYKFMQLKDGYGQTQIIIEDQSLQDTCSSVPENTVIQITGKVLGRPRANINLKYDTGEVEVLVETVKILNPDDPYEGPIKNKEKLKKLSISDIDFDNDDNIHVTDKNGDAILVNDGNNTTGLDKLKVADTSKFTDRTHNCGELTSENIGEKVTICGWLEFHRMDRFIVLRDGYGQTQVLLSDLHKKPNGIPENLTLETILRVHGTVIPRPASTINPKMKTGHIEVNADKIEVVNAAKKNLPFEIRKFNKAGERLRLTYRYLDLRFNDMQQNLRLRSAVIMKMREYLINYLGFVEVETPTLFRRTPGGAQEFVVPTRNPGHFYALVQSPQQFKQMLMAGAIDRYFQIARCYRDEATRPDRQPEFTQLDVELSFTTRDDIMQLIEEILKYSWPKQFAKIVTPFERITYEEAMELYGVDKPDTRYEYFLKNVTDVLENDAKLKEKYADQSAYALVFPANDVYWTNVTRKYYENFSDNSKNTLFVRKFTNKKDILDRLSKFLTMDAAKALIEQCQINDNDLLFLGIGPKRSTQNLLGRIRVDYYTYLLENNKVRKSYANKFLWVVDFPMFEKNAETNKLESVHHPFTAPHSDDMEKFYNSKENEIETIRSQAFDLVLNGQEIGGGSIRIHDRDMQYFVLEHLLKIPYEHFEHLLNALESGCPPHGGIALGLDRLMAIMCRASSIRDVIAFPKSLNGRDPLSSAPTLISEEEKKLYHLSIVENDNEATAHIQEDDDPDMVRSSPSPSPSDTNEIAVKKEETEQGISEENPNETTTDTATEKPKRIIKKKM